MFKNKFPPRPEHSVFVENLRAIVGKKHVLINERKTKQYRTGFRFGSGKVLAVVRPKTLLEQWLVLKACINANIIIIPQAANTGLTGGSTPDDNNYDRDIVIINTMRIKKIYLIREGRQVICLPGATLDELEKTLLPIGREPHSVIGSSCIGASVTGGICNNSGGALVQRGPAYTEMALYAKLDKLGSLQLINHLGIKLKGTDEKILERLDNGDFSEDDVLDNVGAGHDHQYIQHVRDVNQTTPARFNADPSRLYEASGSAGKVMIFALRLDTFPIEKNTTVFYIGTNNTQELTDIRLKTLTEFKYLPISGEYLHRDAFKIAEKYGKDTFLLIHYLGTSLLPKFFALKSRCDAFFEKIRFLPVHLSDRVLQFFSYFFPSHLPVRIKDFHKRFEHHLLLKVSSKSVEESRLFLKEYFANGSGDYFECTNEEGEKAFLHRFAAAGAANRYRALHTRSVQDIIALDIALPRNERNWFEKLPQKIENSIIIKIYYGHFLCHVFHQDYIVKKGNDCLQIEHEMWKLLDIRGAEYPAEHNVGHLYYAKTTLRDHYMNLDPHNCFNPGIGHTSKLVNYSENIATDKNEVRKQ